MKLPTYLPRTTIVWTAIVLAFGLLLHGTPYFPQVLPILAGGVVWFVVLAPGAMRRSQPTPSVPEHSRKRQLGKPMLDVTLGVMIGVVIGVVVQGTSRTAVALAAADG